MASSKRTVKTALTFKASFQLLIQDSSQKRPWYKCINSHAAQPSRKPLSSDLSYAETTPYPDVASALEWLYSLETYAHALSSSEFCMEGATTTLTAPRRWAENLHSTSYTFPRVLGDSSALHLPLCPLAQMANRCPNPFPKFPWH